MTVKLLQERRRLLPFAYSIGYRLYAGGTNAMVTFLEEGGRSTQHGDPLGQALSSESSASEQLPAS